MESAWDAAAKCEPSTRHLSHFALTARDAIALVVMTMFVRLSAANKNMMRMVHANPCRRIVNVWSAAAGAVLLTSSRQPRIVNRVSSAIVIEGRLLLLPSLYH